MAYLTRLDNVALTLCLAILISASSASLGANTPVKTFVDLPPILERSVIRELYRDSNGFLWIASQDALHKYDGAKTISYGPSETGSRHLAIKQVLDITEGPKGRLLAGTGNGLLLVWNTSFQEFDVIASFGNWRMRFIKFVHSSTNGDVWIGSDQQLILLDSNLNFVKRWSFGEGLPSAGIPNQTILAFAQDELQRLVLVTGSSLLVLDKKTMEFSERELPDFESDLAPKISVIHPLDNQLYLVGTDTGHIALIEQSTLKIVAVTRLSQQQVIDIHSILFIEDGILIGSDGGLHWASHDLSEIVLVKNSEGEVSSDIVYSLLENKSGAIGGTYSGLQQYIFSGFTARTVTSNSKQNYVSKIEQDKIGNIWIASHSGLFLYDTERDVHTRIGGTTDHLGMQGLTDQRVASIAVQDGEIIWIAPVRGKLQKYLPWNGRFEAIEIPGSDYFEIPDIEYVDRYEELWVATYNNGLYRLKSESIESFLRSGRLGEKQLLKIFAAENGDMVFANFDDAYLFDRQTESFTKIMFSNADGEPIRILSIIESNTNDIWIATEHNGLFMWTAEDRLQRKFLLRRSSGADSLNQATILDMQLDDSDNLWLTTPRELFKLEKAGSSLSRLSDAGSLTGGEFSWASSLKSDNGEMFFGAINSYIKFHPDDIELDLTPPNTILSSIHFPDKSYVNILPPQEEKTVEISHYDHFVTFEFSVDDFIGYQENQFRYKLEGFDPKWRDIGFRNSATYTNLPAGNYTLRAVGANAAGIWDDTGLALPVKVFPPPWRSWWAHMLYTLAGLLAFWAAHRTYQSYLIERKIAVLAQEMDDTAEQAEDEMQEQLEFQDELLQTAYTHKVDTLGLVKAALGVTAAEASELVGSQSGSSRSSQRVLSALTLMESCMFYGAGGPSGDVRKFSELALADLLESSPTDADTVITINEISGALIPAPVCSVLAVVLYELLDNCVQHAFSPESHANYIRLQITESREVDTGAYVYELYVGDSGAGLPLDLFVHPTHGSGAATLLALLAEFGGEARVTEGSDSAVVIRIVDERIEPYA